MINLARIKITLTSSLKKYIPAFNVMDREFLRELSVLDVKEKGSLRKKIN